MNATLQLNGERRKKEAAPTWMISRWEIPPRWSSSPARRAAGFGLTGKPNWFLAISWVLNFIGLVDFEHYMLINWFILQERSTEQRHYPGCPEVSSCWGAQVSLNSGIAGSNAITEIYLFEIVTFVILCQVWDCLCHCAQGKLFRREGG